MFARKPKPVAVPAPPPATPELEALSEYVREKIRRLLEQADKLIEGQP